MSFFSEAPFCLSLQATVGVHAGSAARPGRHLCALHSHCRFTKLWQLWHLGRERVFSVLVMSLFSEGHTHGWYCQLTRASVGLQPHLDMHYSIFG